jgi:dCMP deaminase
MDRLERDEYFAKVVELTAQRSSCCRAGVGAIAVQDRRIVATGYNGPPPGVDCLAGEVAPELWLGCDAEGATEGCKRAIHAEANLVAWAARAGVQLQGATIWSTHAPCRRCAQLLLAAGIEQLVYIHDYRLGRPDLLADGGVEVFVWEEGEEKGEPAVKVLWHPITHRF